MSDKSVSSKRKLDFIETFPDEMKLEIFAYLDAEALEKSGLVGFRWRGIAQDWLLWKKLTYREFPEEQINLLSHHPALNAELDWHAVYQILTLCAGDLATLQRAMIILQHLLSGVTQTSYQIDNQLTAMLVAFALKRSKCKLTHLNINTQLSTKYAALIIDTLQDEHCPLKSLDLNYRSSPKQIYQFSKMLKHQNCPLESLTLRNMKFGNTRARIFADAIASPHSRLTAITFVNSDVTVSGGWSFADAVAYADHIYHRKITLEGNRNLLKMIESVKNTMTLVDQGAPELVLWKSNITLTQLMIIADKLTINANDTTSLNLGNNHIDDMGAQVIADLLIQDSCSLKTLMLHYNRMGLVGIKAIAKSLKHPYCKIESLNLLKNKMSSEGVQELAEAVVIAKLLYGRRITIKGVSGITEVIKNVEKPIKNLSSPVTVLSFWGSHLQDIHARIIAAKLMDCQCKLKELNLGWNSITDEGAKTLADAIKHPNCSLRLLNIQHNNIGPDGYRALIEACFYAKEHYGREIEIKGLQGSNKKLFSTRAKKYFKPTLYKRNFRLPYKSRVFNLL